MSVVYLDLSAIEEAQAGLRTACDTVRNEAERHYSLSERAGQLLHDMAEPILGELNLQHWFDPWGPWETSGLGGLAWECSTSHGICDDVRRTAIQTVSDLVESHGSVVGSAIAARADGVRPALESAVGAVWDVADFFSPNHLLDFLRQPWLASDRFREVGGTISSAADALEEFLGYLDRLRQREVGIIQEILSALRGQPIQTNKVPASRNDPMYQSIQKGDKGDFVKQLISDYDDKTHGHTPIAIGTVSEGIDVNGRHEKAIVVRLQGIHGFTQANNPGNAILAWAGVPDMYEREIRGDINAYLRANHLPPNTPIIIEGHSLGGMEAQRLVADESSNHFNIVAVDTYGSPNLHLGRGHVQPSNYNMYQAPGDVVPMLSQTPSVFTGERWVDGGSWNPIEAHGDYGKSQYLSHTALPFHIHDISNVDYFSAPSQ